MRSTLLTFMVFLSFTSNSYSATQSRCDFVQVSLSNINAVAKSFGAKSFVIETKEARSADDSVAFSFIAANGQKHLGVNHVNSQTCESEFYNVQVSKEILVK